MGLRIAIDALIVISLFFAVAGTKGVIKMPDAFCRMQASTCTATMGVLGTMIGALLYAIFVMGSAAAAIKIGVIALMIIVTNPIGAHAIAKGAYKAGVRSDREMTVDDYGRDFNE